MGRSITEMIKIEMGQLGEKEKTLLTFTVLGFNLWSQNIGFPLEIIGDKTLKQWPEDSTAWHCCMQ